MTENKPIINKVNVKECKYYCNGKCERYEEFVEADYANYRVKCICEKENDLGTYDICDYQQLARKIQECERYKEEIMLLRKGCDEEDCTKTCPNMQIYERKLKQAEQKLEKIEKIVKDFHYAKYLFTEV